MIVWQDPKNPLEVKDYTFDWTKDLGSDTITTATSTFVNGQSGGMTIATTTFANPYSAVWLQGGTSGSQALIRGTVTTAGGRTFTELGLITIGEDADPAKASVAQLQDDLAALKSARLQVLTGGQIREVWRDGRRIVYNVATAADLERAIATYEGLIADATVTASGAKRRFRALSVRF